MLWYKRKYFLYPFRLSFPLLSILCLSSRSLPPPSYHGLVSFTSTKSTEYGNEANINCESSEYVVLRKEKKQRKGNHKLNHQISHHHLYPLQLLTKSKWLSSKIEEVSIPTNPNKFAYARQAITPPKINFTRSHEHIHANGSSDHRLFQRRKSED
jgi:hypothetical protein